jgi:hypothetical protein
VDPSLLCTGCSVSYIEYFSNSEFLLLLTKYYPDHQIKYSDTGRVCSMYGREKRYLEGFGGEI